MDFHTSQYIGSSMRKPCALQPHITTEILPDGKVQLNSFDGDHWERQKFDTWEELEIHIWQMRGN